MDDQTLCMILLGYLILIWVILIQRLKLIDARRKKVPPVIKYDLDPITFDFELEWDSQDARRRGLSHQEELHQQRRQIAALVSDRVYGLIVDPKTHADVVHTVTDRVWQNHVGKYKTYSIFRIYPVKQLFE